MRNILLPYSANLISLRSVLTLRNVVTPNSIFYQRLLIRQLGLWMTSKDHLFKCPNRLSKQQNKGGQSWNLNYPNVDSRYLKALQVQTFKYWDFIFSPLLAQIDSVKKFKFSRRDITWSEYSCNHCQHHPTFYLLSFITICSSIFEKASFYIISLISHP